ncbi:branched-chain amino acid ABC transporter permease [Haladaptatus sp. DYF46]|uniref:branched-chain amino acid ABC transporter permease n=1 Tax=Haladaptatus sp. DYF46 TaxID=2886041 RepID=UPI001E3BAAEE|nr:branched-chain amino acid ABC transporter permease [Haladaptatus sp. DYF46]
MSDETSERTTEDGPSMIESDVASTWDRFGGSERSIVGFTVLAVALFPWLFVRAPVISGLFQGWQGLTSLILIWGIFALGFNLLLGYTGLLSFGHAAFWGGAAYAAGIFSASVNGSPILMVVVGTLFAVLLAWILGFISLRRGGIYFSILTLAFGQMAYYLALSPLQSLTNGENGFTDVNVGNLFGFLDAFAATESIPLDTPVPLVGDWLYVFVGAITVLCVAAIVRILHSPYGLVFKAIRENEQRASFVGLNVWRYKLMAFILSGTFAGVAGSLFVVHGSYVPVESLYWTTSGEIVVMTVLGGVGSMVGPMLGAGLYLYVENVVSSDPAIAPYWHLILGLIFVAVIALFPTGIWGIVGWVRDVISGPATEAEPEGSD